MWVFPSPVCISDRPHGQFQVPTAGGQGGMHAGMVLLQGVMQVRNTGMVFLQGGGVCIRLGLNRVRLKWLGM